MLYHFLFLSFPFFFFYHNFIFCTLNQFTFYFNSILLQLLLQTGQCFSHTADTSFSGSSSPGDETSREKSPSGKKPSSSISLYNLRLYCISFSILIPLSPSRKTFTLFVGFILISTKKTSGSVSISSFTFVPMPVFDLPCSYLTKEEGNGLRSLLIICFRCKSKGNKVFVPKLITHAVLTNYYEQ